MLAEVNRFARTEQTQFRIRAPVGWPTCAKANPSKPVTVLSYP